MTTKEFKMDVVMPHNNYSGLRKSLESLRKYTPPENLGTVILIDQNIEYQKDVDSLVDVHIYTNGKNWGFAKSMNVGIRLSDADFVACMNDDVEIMNPKWIEGIIETFNRYSTALCVSPASPRNPRASGAEPIDCPGFEWRENWDDEIYNKLLTEVGKNYIIDGICMFFPIFRREMLEKLPGIIPGKCWFDEHFYPGGGEDYDMNRRAYLSGMRCLGTNLSYVYHWWYSTKRISDGIAGVKHCGSLFNDKWGDNADIYGKTGKQEIPMNKIRSLEDCK